MNGQLHPLIQSPSYYHENDIKDEGIFLDMDTYLIKILNELTISTTTRIKNKSILL